MPAVLEFIPYRQRDLTSVRDSMHHPYLAGHGFAGVRVDLRGSGDSEGVLTDEYLERELRDAEEVLAWLAAQPTTCPGPRSDSATLRATVMSGVVKLLPGALMVTGLSELAAGAMVAGSSRRRCWPAFSPACPADPRRRPWRNAPSGPSVEVRMWRESP